MAMHGDKLNPLAMSGPVLDPTEGMRRAPGQAATGRPSMWRLGFSLNEMERQGRKRFILMIAALCLMGLMMFGMACAGYQMVKDMQAQDGALRDTKGEILSVALEEEEQDLAEADDEFLASLDTIRIKFEGSTYSFDVQGFARHQDGSRNLFTAAGAIRIWPTREFLWCLAMSPELEDQVPQLVPLSCSPYAEDDDLPAEDDDLANEEAGMVAGDDGDEETEAARRRDLKLFKKAYSSGKAFLKGFSKKKKNSKKKKAAKSQDEKIREAAAELLDQDNGIPSPSTESPLDWDHTAEEWVEGQESCDGNTNMDSKCLSETDPTNVYKSQFFYPYPAQYLCSNQDKPCLDYKRGTGKEYPVNDDFQAYSEGAVIGMSNSNYEVTAGHRNFVSRHFGCSDAAKTNCRFGWGHIQAYTFRLWIQDRYMADRVQYTDFKFSFQVYPRYWLDNNNNEISADAPGFGTSAANMRQSPRIAIEARYQAGGSGSFYLILMHDGLVMAKRRCCGMRYFSIQDTETGAYKVRPESLKDGLQFQKKYTVEVNMKGSELKFSVNNQLLFRGEDASFSWGALGVRTDMMNAYVRNIRVSEAD